MKRRMVRVRIFVRLLTDWQLVASIALVIMHAFCNKGYGNIQYAYVSHV